MDNDFLIKARKLVYHLDRVTEKDVQKLEKKGYELIKKVEKTIIINSDIGEKTVADAIMDRLVHDAHRIELMGDSMRKTRKKHQESLVENAD